MLESHEVTLLFEKGLEAFSQKKFDQAEYFFQAVLRKDSKHLVANVKLAHICQEKNLLEEAYRHYQMALEVDPQNPEILYGQGVLNEKLGLYHEAEKKYLECLTHDPSQAMARNNLAAIFLRKGNYEQAKEQYLKAIEIDPKNFNLYRNLGILYQQLHKEQHAKKAYSTALNLNPNQVDVMHNLSLILMNLGEWKQACLLLRRIRKIESHNLKAKMDLQWLQSRMEKEKQALSLIKENELDRAARIFKEIIQKNERDFSAQMHLGDIYLLKEEYELALQSYEKAEGIAPHHPGLNIRLANSLFNLRRFEEAIPRYQEFLKACPEDVYGLFYLGLAYAHCGRNQDSLETFGKAIQLDPNLPEVHNNMGILLKREGRLREAEEAYKKATRCNSQYLEAYFNLANLYYETGRYSEAIQGYEQVLKINPNFSQAQANIEWIKEKLPMAGF